MIRFFTNRLETTLGQAITVTALCLALIFGAGLMPVMGQTGTIRGSVRDDATDKPLQGATVVVDFSGQKGTTNLYGDFLIGGVPVGDVSITIYYPQYRTRRIDGLRVVAGRTTVVNTHLKEELLKVNDSVNAKRYQDTEISVITEVKNSENFATGISAEELLRTQDVDAAQSLKRVTGVLINDERFVIIRGLNERYNQVMLNDVPAPSMEVDSRAFSFDVVPTALIDRMMVYKSGSADLPGDFAGGIVKLYTKDIPDSNRWYFGSSFGYRQQTTIREAQRYLGSSTDVWGFDDGTRDIAGKVPEPLPALKVINGRVQYNTGRGADINFNNNWRTDVWRSLPDFRFNLGYTGKFHLGKSLVGTLTMLDYQNTNQITAPTRQRYRQNGDRTDTVFRQLDESYTNSVRVGGIHNWTFAIDNRNKIEFKNLLNILTRDNTTLRTEYDFQGSKNPIRRWESYNFQYERRLIYAGQLAGTHYISNNTQFKWAGGYSLTNRNEPNTRRFRQYNASPFGFGVQRADYFGKLSRDTIANYRDASHFYSNLNENVITGSAQLEQVLNPLADEQKQLKLTLGGFVEQKSRDFKARLFNYQPTTYRDSLGRYFYQRRYDSLSWPDPFAGNTINDRDGLVVNEVSKPTDQYKASNSLYAGFASLYIPFSTRLSTRIGVRYEANTQSVTTNNQTTNITLGSILPSLHLSYDFNDQALFRFAYNASVIRPALGELAPFRNYDFQFDAFRIGNLDLKTTNIQNLDARLEFYPTRLDLITIGGFFKLFDKPIELVMDSVLYLTNLHFINTKSAIQYGIEFEARKSLKDLSIDPFIQCLAVGANLTVTQSQVTVTDEQRASGLDDKRPMLGQSPYSVNLGLYYINPKQRAQASIMYNVYGPRVWAVGNAIHPTIYEMPRHMLSFNISKEIGRHFEGRLTIHDLLNMPYRLVQDSNRNGNPQYNSAIIANYRMGTLATVGLLFKL